MIENLTNKSKKKMDDAIKSLKDRLSKIRTGRANPEILDPIKVMAYDSEVPLNQVANISNEDNRTLLVNVWDKKTIADVEKAIINSNLGLNPSTAGTVIRLNMPLLTEESRKKFAKQAREECENSKISIRNIRRDLNNELKQAKKDALITEDEESKGMKKIQKMTDDYIKTVDNLLNDKTENLMNF